MNKGEEIPENQKETVQLYRLPDLDRQTAYNFCMYLFRFGASFYTMRDKIVYAARSFSRWEIEGIENMIKQFAPGYNGSTEDFYAKLTHKEPFVQFMVQNGGMGRVSCYRRFKYFRFRPWEIKGLRRLFLQYNQIRGNNE